MLSTVDTYPEYLDVEKAIDSKQIRAGKGKLRNRCYTVYTNSNGVQRASRNLTGFKLCCVDSLNLIQLAPGSHMGCFYIWS